MLLEPKLFNGCYKFAVVRNPWDRLVSAYYFFKGGPPLPAEQEWARKHIDDMESFEDFVHRWVWPDNIHKNIHFHPQSDFLKVNGRIGVDFLGRFESLAADYQRLQDVLGIGQSLEHLNASNFRSDYRIEYNDRTAEIVADVYSADVRLLGYCFE